ncbi:Conserved protein of unknown function [Mycobacterium canettii CIPT 140070010]|nr:Conserved protein of unknown function [Mycobacterium canettii CIPT 140070010]
MAPLAVDPAALDSAGGAVVAADAGLGAVISSLTAALAGCAGMAGDDPAGAVFGRSYDGSAAALVQAMSVARNGLCNLGDGVRMSAHNYSLAEAMSDVAGRAAPLAAPPPSGCVGAGAPPSAVGGGGGAPKGWGWVAPYIGMIWPNGDSTKLRAAAAAWRSAGTQSLHPTDLPASRLQSPLTRHRPCPRRRHPTRCPRIPQSLPTTHPNHNPTVGDPTTGDRAQLRSLLALLIWTMETMDLSGTSKDRMALLARFAR